MIQSGFFLKNFLNLNLSIVLWFRFLVAQEPIIELINKKWRWLRNLVLGLGKMVNLLSNIQTLQTLLLGIYKIKHNLSESCSKYLFSALNGNYNLRSQSDFGVLGINTVCGANSISYFGPMIWNSLPNDLRNICDFDLKWKYGDENQLCLW